MNAEEKMPERQNLLNFTGGRVMNELAGEDYVGNKRREKEAALNEAIDGVVTDCVLTVNQILWSFYEETNSDWQRRADIYREAKERIKKFLK